MRGKDPGPRTVENAFLDLKSGREGLSSGDAEQRLEKFGYNQIPEKRENYLLLFVRKFYGPVQLLLWIVILLSYLLGHIADFYIITALLVFNAIVGFVEEYRADNSVRALKSMLTSRAKVLRDRHWTQVSAETLVPGDVIRIRIGDIVPADAMIIESDLLEIDEAIITGESMPVEKEVGSQVYQATVVKRGEATCIVNATGTGTRYGKTAELVKSAKPRSHLEDVIMGFVKYLVAGDAAVVLIMFLYGFFRLHLGLGVMVPFLLVIFIASVPVALSAAFTVAMALGTEKLAKRSILVTRLEAIENTATMGVLCVDKTGTITQNRITVKNVVALRGSTELVIKHAAEASRKEDNDPIDDAVLYYSKSHGIRQGKQLEFEPFDPSTKRTYAAIEDRGTYEVTKGAVLTLLKLARPGRRDAKVINEDVASFAKRGFRTIAVAIRHRGGRWLIIGLIALYDAPRHDARSLIREMHDLGISVKMLTGDNVAVADQISREVGIGGNIISMDKALPGERDLENEIIRSDGFANIYPEDKYTIVNALQKRNMIVGMTGDGVNDAPALRQADVGIAVSNATDVAKSAAALVLTKNGLEVIVDAVKESRRIFERMATYTMVKVAKVFQIVGFVGITFIAFNFIPITPLLLILLIFTNDIVNISISTDNTGYSGKPDVWNIRSMVYVSGIMGVALMLEALLFIPIGLGVFGLSVAGFQTLIFLMLNVTDQMTVLNFRERRFFWKSRPSTALIVSSLIGISVGIIISYYGIVVQGIGTAPILLTLALAVIFLFVNDAIKIAALRHFKIGS